MAKEKKIWYIKLSFYVSQKATGDKKMDEYFRPTEDFVNDQNNNIDRLRDKINERMQTRSSAISQHMEGLNCYHSIGLYRRDNTVRIGFMFDYNKAFEEVAGEISARTTDCLPHLHHLPRLYWTPVEAEFSVYIEKEGTSYFRTKKNINKSDPRIRKTPKYSSKTKRRSFLRNKRIKVSIYEIT
jgi:hypothetical protein